MGVSKHTVRKIAEFSPSIKLLSLHSLNNDFPSASEVTQDYNSWDPHPCTQFAII